MAGRWFLPAATAWYDRDGVRAVITVRNSDDPPETWTQSSWSGGHRGGRCGCSGAEATSAVRPVMGCPARSAKPGSIAMAAAVCNHRCFQAVTPSVPWNTLAERGDIPGTLLDHVAPKLRETPRVEPVERTERAGGGQPMPDGSNENRIGARSNACRAGAACRNRTDDLFITSEPL